MVHRRARTTALVAALCGLLSCSPDGRAAAAPAPGPLIEAAVAAGLRSPTLTVLGGLPHDTSAWTQGLEIADGVLYEGTGRTGRSQLRELDPTTGRLLRATEVPEPLYGEGITVVGPRIWQLTWRDGVALEWDRATLRPGRRVDWTGEGWGLCRTSAGALVASDGGDRLRVLDPDTLRERASVPVRVGGQPLRGLNELECVAGAVWANVFETDWLVRIELGADPASPASNTSDSADSTDSTAAAGTVSAAVLAADLLGPGDRARAGVLNGIAAVPGTDEFLLTGKLWPTIFRVRFDG
ncbi:MAG: glutaminyl-peptide cyclotransferase [Pseudonocardia sp.]